MRWLIVVLVALTTLLATPAFAQGIPRPPAAKPSAADEATAKRNFESGLKLFGEGAFAEALIAFEQSYRIGGRPSALKNLAQCHRNLKHFVDAYEAYEQTLTAHEAQLSAADKTAVKQALEELSILTGTLIVNVSAADAEIEIDGKTAGRSPMAKPKRVAVAAHAVRVTKSGFAPSEQTVNVGSQDNAKVDVTLEPEKTTGRLVVRDQGAREVHVIVDGEDKGPAPWEGDVGAGEHTVEAKGPRFAAEPRKVRVAAKDRVDVVLDAQPLLGRLRVTTVPATATIAIDGHIVGAGSWDGELAEGTHRVEVTLSGQPSQVRDITVGRGQSIVQEIPVIAAIAGRPPADYRGVYVKLMLQGELVLSGQASNAKPGFTEEDSSFKGAGLALGTRVGYAWDWYAAELVGAFMFLHTDATLRTSGAQTTAAGAPSDPVRPNDESNDINFFLGAGPRATTKDDGVRFTFAIAPGIAIRNFSFRRKGNDGDLSSTGNNGQNRFQNNTTGTSGPNDETYKRTGYTALGFVADGGILIGSTPGTKFYLGVNAWIDFPPSDLVVGPDTVSQLPNDAFRAPGRGIVGIDSVQFYIGPSIGIQFGH